MTRQIINIGAFPNDGTGDSVRVAMDKCNQNFIELYVGDYFVPRNNPHVYGTLTVSNMLGGDVWTLAPGDPGSGVITATASGPDADIQLDYIPKGAGTNRFYGRGALQAVIGGPPGANRAISLSGSLGGNPVIQSLGGGSITIPDLVMTGNPTAPTQPLTDSDTSVATTAFVTGWATANVGLLAANNIWTGTNFFNGPNTVVGHTAAIDASVYKFQSHGIDSASNAAIFNWGALAGGFGYGCNRSKSGTIGTHAAVVDEDFLGQYSFRGSDGAAFATGAVISGIVEGAVASGQVPGKLIFGTRPAGGPQLVQRLLIDSLGRVVAGPSATSSMGGYLSLAGASAAAATFCNECYVNSPSGATIALRHSRGATVGALAALQLNDAIGSITFEGVDSVPSMTSGAAFIQVNVDGALATNHIPCRFAFWTDDGTTIAERMRLTRDGSLRIFNGGAAPPATLGGYLGIAGLTGSNVSFQMEDYQAAAGSPVISMKHSRGAYGAQGALLVTDPLGQFFFVGSDGTGFVNGAGIAAYCDVAPTTGHVPSKLSFFTDNGTNFQERIKITPLGGLVIDTATNVDPGVGGVAATLFVGALKGGPGNADAAAGFVGEYLESVSQITNAITANTLTNITSLSLTAGDWDLCLRVAYQPTGGVGHNFEIEISTISATFSGVIGNSYLSTAFGAGSTSMGLTERRLRVASTTTVFAVVRMNVGGNAGYQFFARRRR